MKHLRSPGLFTSMETVILFFRFSAVGFSGLLADMTVMFLLVDVSQWGFTAAKVAAAEIAICNNFAWNELWTFHARRISAKLKSRRRRLFEFHIGCLGGVGISLLLLNIQVSVLQLDLYLANLVAITVASVWNFTFSLKVSWNPSDVRVSRVSEGFQA